MDLILGIWVRVEGPIDRIPPVLTIEIAVPIYDPVVRGLDQAKEQRDCEDQPEAVQPLPDLWLHPSSQAKQIAHCDLKTASAGDPLTAKPATVDRLATKKPPLG